MAIGKMKVRDDQYSRVIFQLYFHVKEIYENYHTRNINMESVLYKRMRENGNYFIGSNSRVFSIKRGIFLKNQKDKDGYVIFPINKKKYKMHRIVFSNFVEEIPIGMVINHKDLNKSNNNIGNLECVTIRQNHRHAMDTYKDGESGMFGSGHYKAILTLEQATEIVKISPNKWSEQKRLARKYGVSEGLIRCIAKGRAWKHIPRD